jgi:hypothetical protein
MESVETEAPKVRTKEGRPKPQPVSPLNGVPTPYGRRKGVPNKVTKTIREAVEMAARDVTDSQGRKGLAAWLLERANGTIADRQIFAAMVAKALPLQVQAQGGSGGITINLAWLAGRGLTNVSPTAQPNVIDAQLIESTARNDVDLRVEDTNHPEPAAIDHQADTADPHPPIERQEGGA